MASIKSAVYFLLGTIVLLAIYFPTCSVGMDDSLTETNISLSIEQISTVSTETLRSHWLKHCSKAGAQDGFARFIRRELAKRGEPEPRKQVFEECQSANLAVQARAIEDAAYIGDGEAIRHLGQLLYDKNPGGRLSYKDASGKLVVIGDEGYTPPRQLAAMKLAQVVQNPPVPAIGPQKRFYTEEDVSQWRQWWEKNKQQYE